MNRLMLSALVCGFATVVCADPTVLNGNTYRIQDTADASYTVSSVHEDADWPSGLPTPSFWFDCKQTNDWEFATDANGRLCVSKIPSLVGDGRSLTSDQMETGSKFPWSSKDMKLPLFVASDPTLGGQPMIDLCDGKSLNSQIGLNFNAVYVHEGDSAKQHLLDKIGTVFAIYGSDFGGGSFLGGGYGYAGKNGNLWTRNRTQTLSSDSADSVRVDYPSPIISSSYSAFAQATVRHFGHVSTPDASGFTGGWEVFTFRCANNETSASGIGMGDVSPYYHSGGMKIAEMIFFSEVLTDEQVGQVERHLARKWFPARREDVGVNGRTTLGWYRSAANASSLSTTFDVPAEETLELGKLTGGRVKDGVEPKIVKTGEGALEVGDFADYGGTVESRGGTLKFCKRAVPTSVDQLADGLFVRFDADDSACCDDLVEESDGRLYVRGIKNLAAGVLLGKPVAAYQSTAANRPWVLKNAIGNKSVFDFGLQCAGETRRVLKYATFDAGAGTYANATLPSVFTVVALVGAQSNGGHIMDNMFQREMESIYSAAPFDGSRVGYANNWTQVGLMEYEKTFSGRSDTLGLNATTGRIFVNGRKLDDHAQGYETPGYQVAAWCVPGYKCDYLGGTSGTQCGNLRLGEILVWLRPLSDEELMDAQAYLAKKWLNQTLAGYRDDAKDGVAQIQKLMVSGKTTVDVPAGAAARIDRMTLEGDVVKTGEGTLYVGQDAETKYNLVVKGGAVKVLEPQVSESCELAKGPALHLDAADEKSFIFWPKNGTNFVHRWFAQEGAGCAMNSAAAETSHPWLDTENTLNGMPCVNFGLPGYERSEPYTRPSMSLDHAYDNARSIFVVHGSQNGGNTLFGCANGKFDASSNVQYDWPCAGENGKWTCLLTAGANENLINGEIRVDGELTDRTAHPDGWSLIEFHTLGGVMISALNCLKDATYNLGGNRYCEILVYERPLSEREKVATRNYLMKKWFPSRPLEPLPSAVPEKMAVAKAYAADAGETFVLDPEITEISSVEGEGTIAKTGAATLKLADFSEFGGTLEVRDGTLDITLPPATNDTSLVTDGRILHLDAQDGATLAHEVESGTGSNVISRWTSKVGDICAVPTRHPNWANTTNMPFYLAHDLNGYPIVSMYSDADYNGRKCAMAFVDGEGKSVTLRNIRTAFWVLGSQEGGGLLFGGGYKVGEATDTLSCWFRRKPDGTGQDEGLDYRSGLIGYQTTLYWPCLGKAGYWVNGNKTAAATPSVLSGGYDIVAMRLGDGVADADTPNTTGLAMLDPVNTRGYSGHQRLGELIVYDRVLSDEEMASMQAYLKAKWGYTQKSDVNAATVDLAADTTLKTMGNQYVGKLTGAGTVDGDVTAGKLVGEVGADPLTIAGTYTIAKGLTVELKGLSSVSGDLKDTVITLLEAEAIDGLENRLGVVFTGDAVPEGYKAKLCTDNGRLAVIFKPCGLVMIVR